MKALFRCEKNWQKINVQRFSANFFSLKTESAAQSPIPVILRHSLYFHVAFRVASCTDLNHNVTLLIVVTTVYIQA